MPAIKKLPGHSRERQEYIFKEIQYFVDLQYQNDVYPVPTAPQMQPPPLPAPATYKTTIHMKLASATSKKKLHFKMVLGPFADCLLIYSADISFQWVHKQNCFTSRSFIKRFWCVYSLLMCFLLLQ